MSMMPNTSVSPAASRNSIKPSCSPFNSCSAIRERGRNASVAGATIHIPPPSYGGGAPSYGAEGGKPRRQSLKISDLESASIRSAAFPLPPPHPKNGGHLPRRTEDLNLLL